jgi:hypothetical protein
VPHKVNMIYRHSVLIESFGLAIHKRLIPLSIKSVLAFRSICDTSVCISYLAERLGCVIRRPAASIRIGFFRRTRLRNTTHRLSRTRSIRRVRAAAGTSRR